MLKNILDMIGQQLQNGKDIIHITMGIIDIIFIIINICITIITTDTYGILRQDYGTAAQAYIKIIHL